MITRSLVAICFALITAPAQAQERRCDRVSTFSHTEPTGPVEIIPGLAGTRIYPCGFTLLQKGNTLDFKIWSADAGTNCAGGVIDMSPQLSLPTDVQINTRILVVGPFTELGNSICIQTFGAGALTGVLYWAQY